MKVGQASADSTSALLYTALGKGKLVIRNHGPNSVFIGPSGVSITTGFELALDETVEVGVDASEAIHAVCDTAETADVSYALSWVY